MDTKPITDEAPNQQEKPRDALEAFRELTETLFDRIGTLEEAVERLEALRAVERRRDIQTLIAILKERRRPPDR
jgi:hypothetical protein